MRLLDLECRKCGAIIRDKFFRRVPDKIVHRRTDKTSRCRGTMAQVFLPAGRGGQWDDKKAVVVYRKPDGSISYPARNDAPTPPGCERVVMRSLAEVNRFERQNNVCCEAMHFNQGREMPTIDRLPMMSEPERFRRFMDANRD